MRGELASKARSRSRRVACRGGEAEPPVGGWHVPAVAGRRQCEAARLWAAHQLVCCRADCDIVLPQSVTLRLHGWLGLGGGGENLQKILSPFQRGLPVWTCVIRLLITCRTTETSDTLPGVCICELRVQAFQSPGAQIRPLGSPFLLLGNPAAFAPTNPCPGSLPATHVTEVVVPARRPLLLPRPTGAPGVLHSRLHRCSRRSKAGPLLGTAGTTPAVAATAAKPASRPCSVCCCAVAGPPIW